MINFGLAKVEGFASIEYEEFDWGLPGLNVIQAPNGYGKTKFINALMWCLYGKTLSGSVEPWAHTRSSIYKGTKVSTIINSNSIEARITRYKDYSKWKDSLILEIDGEDQKKGKRETQIEIEKLIGYSYDLFKNTIIFGQKLKRLISESGPAKKKIFDEAFEIAYIPKAKKLADEKLKEHRVEFMKAESVVQLIQEKVFGKESELNSQKIMVENFEEDKNKEIKTEREIIAELRTKLRNITENNLEADLIKHEWELELEMFEKDALSEKEILKLEKDLIKLESDVDRWLEDKILLKRDIDRLNSDLKSLPEKCSECGRAYSKQDRGEQKLRIKLDLIEKQKVLQSKEIAIGAIQGQILEVETEIASANNLLESINSCKNTIEKLEVVLKDIQDIKDEIQGHKNKINSIKERKLKNNIIKLNLELMELKRELKDKAIVLRKVKRDVNINEWLVKDPLSNSGLKAFIFNWMLDDINERLEFYTKFINFQVAFMIDMKSANKDLETYVFKDGEPVPYEDLSGGQQQAVDIVTAFAIHDVVSGTKDCSLLIMDEIFESLDKDNIEIITELIQDKAKSKCLYLVTHRNEFNPTNANIIRISYSHGITRIA